MSDKSNPSIDQQKAALRRRAKAVREAISSKRADEAATAIAAIGLEFLKPQRSAVVSGFASMPGEIDTGPLLARLHDDGLALALPIMQGRDEALLFRAWKPGDDMAAGPWGIMEPLAGAPAVAPDIVLVPLLAFDDKGNRIGYGGGHFDRTLEELRAARPVTAIGVAYDEQRVDAVPHERYDQRLDWMLTPSGTVSLTGRTG